MNEDIRCAQKVAEISVLTLLIIGILELLIGQTSGSVVATADGTDSLSDAMISFIVVVAEVHIAASLLWVDLIVSRQNVRHF